MYIYPITNKPLTFKSNERAYYTENGNGMSTYTNLFRSDMNWARLSDFLTKHFQDKSKVQTIQFAPSDGSEAYTFIISLINNNKNPNKFFPIKAYDIDDEILNCARSGLLNVNISDKRKFKDKNIDFDFLFKKSDKKLNIEDDTNLHEIETYKVSPILTSKVQFNKGDMFEVIKKVKDEKNTVILCRNILFYMSKRQIEQFIQNAAFVLKQGSVLVTGGLDDIFADAIIQRNGFSKVLPNVYIKN